MNKKEKEGRDAKGKFTEGNTFSVGNEGGRPKSIESPQMMWELFVLYRQKVKEDPFPVIEQKKGGTKFDLRFEVKNKSDVQKIRETVEAANDSTVTLPRQKPLTLEGFDNFLFEEGIISDASDYFENKENRYAEFVPICSRVKKIIRQDHIEGGMANIYNPSITARLNGLKEQSEIEQTNKNINYDLTDLSEEERQKLFELSLKLKHDD